MTVTDPHPVARPVATQEKNLRPSDSPATANTRTIPAQRSLRPRPREDDEAYLRSLRAQAETDIAAGR